MKSPLLVMLVGLLASLWLGGCYDDVKVVQGTVTAVDTAAGTLTVRDERPPNAEVVFGNAGKEGAANGDLVRLAYRQSEQGARIMRLMNLSRDKELAKKGHN